MVIASPLRFLRLNQLFYMVAIVTVATVAATIFSSHHVLAIHSESVVSDHNWTKRLARCQRLNQSLLEIAACADRSSDISAVVLEQAKLDSALAEFQSIAHDIVDDSEVYMSNAEVMILREHVKRVVDHGEQLATLSQKALDRLQTSEGEKSRPFLAKRDASLRSGLGEIASLEHRLRVLQSLKFADDYRKISEYADMEMKLGVIVLLVVAMLLLYGRRLSQRLADAGQQLDQAINAEKAAHEVKSRFLANTSHEIRTPLTAILGYAEELASRQLPNQDRESVSIIQRNADHLLAVLNDILDLSKIDAGKLTIEVKTHSLATLLTDVTALLRIRAAKKNLELTLQVDEPVPSEVCLDAMRVRQVLLNLVGNAIKFTESGGVCICVAFERLTDSAGKLRFRVVDTGIGLTKEQCERLFQAFTQADESTTRCYGGTGLGLTISKNLVELMGGTIQVESQPGKGTTFSFNIPVTFDRESKWLTEIVDPIASPPTVPILPAQKMALDVHVLLAEDGVDNQRLVATILRKAGAVVTVVENGEIAVRETLCRRDSREAFDIVLMDMDMPVLDGYSATQRIREAGISTPIIALTANAGSGDREKCLAAGCTDFVTKPINRDQLLAAIRTNMLVAGCETSSCHSPSDAASLVVGA